MNNLYIKDEWLVVEEGFHPDMNRESESIFSIGNGYMGQRANFEEKYSGDSLQGTYVAGVYYPDKTRVGWWKNGYPEYFAKVLNAPSWTGIKVIASGREIDLAVSEISSFRRVLNMREGYLERIFSVKVEGDSTLEITSLRFVSMAEPDIAVIRYCVRSVDYEGEIKLEPFIDADVRNEDTNYGEKFWEEVSRNVTNESGIVTSRTLKTGFHVSNGMTNRLFKNGTEELKCSAIAVRKEYAGHEYTINVKPGDELVLFKYVSVLSSLNNAVENLESDVAGRLSEAVKKGFDLLLEEHKNEWTRIWDTSDVVIEGDVAAQQAIRFNIFHLNQTYTGKDERLNIGPKGFTGEKYGGSTYWDTEAFVLPFFLKTAEQQVGKNLLIYRYRHLQKSIENAEKLGFRNGAALYPMVTMNGEECHNEWEITFEEIHRNGAIAFAINNYIKHTGDESYMAEYGLEVLIGISRFWSQRTTFSENLGRYVILGVTGPNEYENNVNNNWYTNTMAVWTLSYTLSNIEKLSSYNPAKLKDIFDKTAFDYNIETTRWKHIVKDMHLPYDDEERVFLQQDGFKDKELRPASSIPAVERPINQHWSWDRILRSCFIKQADVIQGLYVLEDQFDTATIERNFSFYEPMCVHESSLSACIHSIMASRIGKIDKAYELYLRTARLDLDDYNNEVSDGLHITSMAGTWLAVVEGFGGLRIAGDVIKFNPQIPSEWKSYSFKVLYRGRRVEVSVTNDNIIVNNYSGNELGIILFEEGYIIGGNKKLEVKTKRR
ncbi:MAG TPA: family 65 glycosyl hydrolase domain-containing protein [Bacteroidales bacterium]|nr:family 65 glycosyl hydrolase domain-containing protein [Bacteroidales bacterium]